MPVTSHREILGKYAATLLYCGQPACPKQLLHSCTPRARHGHGVLSIFLLLT
jgi:hypothetical protein